ncbi:DnaK suppressor protein [Kineococcus radiotolerans]|uniref:DnaK suppressor protein n=1 Tax=Kineococcus radiotolerans TaxID=131568 RepID=A0A7W4TNG1_KINRA|nr:TraR/DksA family transcriptional regulator [Kineococcus radiotolerans]MBB2901496.1 DnaK suppressor protein [Kineococcus radiotolerans]
MSAGTATAGAAARTTGRAARAAAVRELPVVPVHDSEEAWTPAELDEVRVELQLEIDRLSAELAEASSSFSALVRSGEGAGDDQVDHGATTAGREHEMTIVNNARELLEQTQRALVRLGSGVYGVCESCDGPVGKARLQAFPRVTLCVRCKSRGERR